MSYKLTNISGGQIVCDLADKKTLRFNNKQSETIKDTEITPHIRNLVLKGLILCEEVSVKETKTKKTTVSNSNKEKEE